jgi:glucokinase
MYASGTALATETLELADESPAQAVALLELAAGDPAAITGELVQAAARAGDPLATRACAAVGDWLGRGLVNLAAALDPDVFVIGGGVNVADGLILGPARARFRANLPGGGYRPQADIVVAALGPQAGIVGAADLARREHIEGRSS